MPLILHEGLGAQGGGDTLKGVPRNHREQSHTHLHMHSHSLEMLIGLFTLKEEAGEPGEPGE